MNSLLADTSKFQICNKIPINLSLNLEEKVNRSLRNLLDNKKIDKTLYDNLYTRGSAPGILYGLPKIHKSNLPMRPILAAYNTHNYKLAKFLSSLLTPYTSNEFTIRNSYDFKNKIHTINNLNKYHMCSFDIESLYTNIPTSDAINILLEKIFKDLTSFHNFTKQEFKNLLNLACNDVYFFFNNKLYFQTNSLAMGSPLSAALANIYLDHYETTWLSTCPTTFKPYFYSRYMDDTFLLFDSSFKAPLFLNFLNNKLPNIKFTCEEETNNSLQFLDIFISKNLHCTNTSIFRKKTFTGLGLNYFSHIPFIYKLNNIKALIYRAYHISSDFHLIHKEFNFITEFLNRNLYPTKIIQNTIKNFLNTIYNKQTTISTATQKIVYIKFPFYDHLSIKLKKELQPILQNTFPQLKIIPIFTNNNKIGSILNHKDRLPDSLRSLVVYKYNCDSCSAIYVGSTMRQLHVRTSEHRGISPRTGKNITNPSHSSIREHTLKHQHQLNPSNFKIITQTNHPSDLRILESFYITTLKPSLNTDSSAITTFVM